MEFFLLLLNNRYGRSLYRAKEFTLAISSSKIDDSSTFLCGEHVMMNQHIKRLKTIHVLSQSLTETVYRQIPVVHGFINPSSQQVYRMLYLHL